MDHTQPTATVKEKHSDISIHRNRWQLWIWQDPIIPASNKGPGPQKSPIKKILGSAWNRGVVCHPSRWPILFLSGVHTPNKGGKDRGHSQILPPAHKNVGYISDWGRKTQGTRSCRVITKPSATGTNKNSGGAQTIGRHLSYTGNHGPTASDNRNSHSSTITEGADGGDDKQSPNDTFPTFTLTQSPTPYIC